MSVVGVGKTVANAVAFERVDQNLQRRVTDIDPAVGIGWGRLVSDPAVGIGSGLLMSVDEVGQTVGTPWHLSVSINTSSAELRIPTLWLGSVGIG